jgi:UDP-2,4-diacetamido-2,4,6-trideoxy-beta-L-altropyranose hydrolase
MSGSDPNKEDLNGARVLLRADAGPEIGSGHAIRCLALKQAWEDAGGHATLASVAPAPGISLPLNDAEIFFLGVEPGSHDDAIETISFARRIGATWLVVDGYRFGADYQQTIKDSGLRLLFIDDYGHAEKYCADIVLNQNAGAREGLYANREASTRLLLGPEYVLLRRQFRRWRNNNREIPAIAKHVLVTTGGGDSSNVTLGIIAALQQTDVKGLEAIVVVGDVNQHRDEIENAIRGSHVPLTLKHSVANMAELMAWADVAISGAGSTCWELAFMGLPNIALVLSDNQEAVAENVNALGVSLNLGRYSDIQPGTLSQELSRLITSPALRKEMSDRGRAFIDGNGASRVVRTMQRGNLTLRRATMDDCSLIWRWASAAEVRAVSFSSGAISWPEHVDWFTRKLAEPSCFMFIAMDNEDQSVGHVRFDLKNESEAQIGIIIDQSKRGLGYGSLLIDGSVVELFRTTSVRKITAFIKPENQASLKAFERAGFRRVGSDTIKGQRALRFSRSANNEIAS